MVSPNLNPGGEPHERYGRHAKCLHNTSSRGMLALDSIYPKCFGRSGSHEMAAVLRSCTNCRLAATVIPGRFLLRIRSGLKKIAAARAVVWEWRFECKP